VISHHLVSKSLQSTVTAEANIAFQRTFKTTSHVLFIIIPRLTVNTFPSLRNMESQEPNRIVIEQEKDWIRVRQNLKSVVDGLVDEQLNRPGVSENLELRKQVTRRIQKVGTRNSSFLWCMWTDVMLARWQIMEETFSLAVPNLQINGHNYEEYLESAYFPAFHHSLSPF
jgi:hypothetical protein